MLQYLLIFIVCSTVGLGLEVIFTATLTKKKDQVHLFGYSSLYYIPLYGIALPLLIVLIYPYIGTLPWYVRGFIYLPFLHFGEYAGMFVLRKINGMSPSEKNYRGKRWSINNLTRLDYAPVFYVLGIFFEFLVRTLLGTNIL